MKNIPFSEDELRKAAASVREAKLQALSSSPAYEHVFSEEFNAGMELLIKRETRRRKIISYTKRTAAAVVAAAAVGLGAWLSVDTHARDALFQWTFQNHENTIVYQFQGTQPSEAIPQYELSLIPEGYTLVEEFRAKHRVTLIYSGGEGKILIFEYWYPNSSSSIQIFDTENAIHEKLEIDGMAAEYYSEGNTQTRNLIWFNEELGIVFTLAVDISIDKDLMVKIAETIILKESSN